ncbi:MAG: hypothetical protein EPN93_06420 [Spirochaetes bacterium]|nr:MAG: hypothetical protein EPN93_06420 [Spirochaetota bacterium]
MRPNFYSSQKRRKELDKKKKKEEKRQKKAERGSQAEPGEVIEGETPVEETAAETPEEAPKAE